MAAQGPQAGATPPAFARAYALQAAGEFAQAADAYDAFLKEHPDNVEARSNLGVVLMRLGRTDAAIAAYREALLRSPSQQAIRLNLGLALYKSARFDEAAETFAEVVASQPMNLQARYLQADCLLRLGQAGGGGHLTGTAGELARQRPRPGVPARDGLPAHEPAAARADPDRPHHEQGRLCRGARAHGHGQARGPGSRGRARGSEAGGRAQSRSAWRAHAVRPGSARDRESRSRRPRARDRVSSAIRPTSRPTSCSACWPGKTWRSTRRVGTCSGHSPCAPAICRYVSSSPRFTCRSARPKPRTDDARERSPQEAPNFIEARVSLATVYYRLKLRDLGDKERAVVEELNRQAQARQPGAAPSLPAATATPPRDDRHCASSSCTGSSHCRRRCRVAACRVCRRPWRPRADPASPASPQPATPGATRNGPRRRSGPRRPPCCSTSSCATRRARHGHRPAPGRGRGARGRAGRSTLTGVRRWCAARRRP